MEDRSVVVIADLRVIHHVFQITDDRCRMQIRTAGWNQRLMHMQRDAEGAADPAEINPGFRNIVGASARHRFCNAVFRTANIRETLNNIR